MALLPIAPGQPPTLRGGAPPPPPVPAPAAQPVQAVVAQALAAVTASASAPAGHNGGPPLEPPAPRLLGPGAIEIDQNTRGLKRSFGLYMPVMDDNGIMHEVLVVHEPQHHHHAKMQRDMATLDEHLRTVGPMRASMMMFAALANVGVEVVEGMAERDYNPIKGWIEDLIEDASDGDPVGDPSGIGRQEWLCVLRSPIPTNADDVTQVTVREGTVGVGTATEKFKTEAQQTSAMISAITGVPIPVINKMKRRDVVRIERWLSPFSTAGVSLKKRTRILQAMLADMGIDATVSEAGDSSEPISPES